MAEINVGSRVRVKIRDPKVWAVGSADALNGLLGTVEELKPLSINGDYLEKPPWYGPALLVRFDKKPRKWWANQITNKWHWFAPGDLEVIP